MKSLGAMSFLLLLSLAFAGCGQDITEPAADPAGSVAAQSLGKSYHVSSERIPFFGSNWLWSFDGYAVYYFYVKDPAVITPDRNLILLEGPTPEARNYEQTVEVTAHWMEQVTFAPKNFNLRGTGPVEFWFFSAAQAEAMVADLVLTRSEMESSGPLKGWATDFLENNLSYPATRFNLTARGNLENGGRFHVNIHERWFGPGPFDANWDGNIILKP